MPGVVDVTSPVAPLVPPRTRPGGKSSNRRLTSGHQVVPLPRVTAVRERSSVYGFAVVNDRGRIAAQCLVQALGWQPGTLLSIRERAGLVVVTADAGGGSRLTSDGHVRLPVTIRRWCGLDADCRVLLAADPAEGRLVVHPAAALDAMVSRHHADVFGGGLA